MSSEGSISSRISQFGLYRTIDARTEEFLKLSKKRQIKQGCVCAAISTAVTVIVVVTLVLIYEYNAVAEAKRVSSNMNWLDFMNNSINDAIIQEKYNKANINIDKNTLQLLPILLNALNRKRYVEKRKEEPTSIYPLFPSRDTTDTTYTKNLFFDTRNWMKMPNSRLYTYQYKTSPIVYFKSSTRNIDYFTKIRKIRDYQRILKYVDKMISEKKTLKSTRPMNDHTENPAIFTTPMKKHNMLLKKATKKSNISELLMKEKKQNCQCPHKISELVNKLLINIQNLLSYLSGHNLKEVANLCRLSKETKQVESSTDTITPASLKDLETQNNFQTEVTTASLHKKYHNRHKYAVDFTNSFEIHKDHTLNNIKKLVKPSFIKQNPFAAKYLLNEEFSTTNSYVMPSEKNDFINERSTESFSKYISNLKIPADVATTVATYIFEKGTYDQSLETKSTLFALADTNYSEDEEYGETTANFANHLNKVDAHSLELVKSKIISEKINHSQKTNSTYPFKGIRSNQINYSYTGPMRKLSNLVANDNNISKIRQTKLLHRFAPSFDTTTPTIRNVKVTTHHTKLLKSSNKPIDKSWINKSQNLNVLLNVQQNLNNNMTLREGAEKFLGEKKVSMETLKHMEEAIQILEAETTNNPENLTSAWNDSNQWETIKLEENVTFSKSMIPNSKSTYLEMQRIDWKQDENHDYDNYNFN